SSPQAAAPSTPSNHATHVVDRFIDMSAAYIPPRHSLMITNTNPHMRVCVSSHALGSFGAEAPEPTPSVRAPHASTHRRAPMIALVATLLSGIAAALTPRVAEAGGFELPDHGARALGRGGANVVGVNDPTAIHYNPG